jgi:hypothetical protein
VTARNRFGLAPPFDGTQRTILGADSFNLTGFYVSFDGLELANFSTLESPVY